MSDFIPSKEAIAFFEAFNDGSNVFLTGPGGVGKSYLIEQAVRTTTMDVSLTASTGVAALKIGGSTVHRWSGMMLGPQAGQSNEAYYGELLKDKRFSVRAGFDRIRKACILVIDEISMLSGRTFDFLEFLCRKVCECEAPFGGIQVIVTGDFLQLPPVRKNPAEPYDWVFQTEAWRRAGFKCIHLTKIHRQTDTAFIEALLAFRVGEVSGRNATLLQSRVRNFPDGNLTRLYTHNVQVDRWNDYRLAELTGEPEDFHAILAGPESQSSFLAQNLLTPQHLQLKPGARVMFTVNQPEARFVNGQTGIVREVHPSRTLIEVESEGHLIPVTQFTWRFDPRDPTSGSFTQFPLRLSYAMTIHKSQGVTLDSAYIDVRAAREPGQAYVALSRIRTLDGLYLKDWFSGVMVSRAAKEFYDNLPILEAAASR
ncbi:AAA family ATPase [Verrucomicrobia bacterium LW23]|nr:AAA family ATPase [Verrucomicrobia bacterium LW23]